MDTIRESVEKNLQIWNKARLEKLEALTAPQVIIDNLKSELVKGNLADKVGKIKDFGHLTFTKVEGKKFRRGAGAVFTTDNGQVFFIPGPYGYFLTDKESK